MPSARRKLETPTTGRGKLGTIYITQVGILWCSLIHPATRRVYVYNRNVRFIIIYYRVRCVPVS